MRLFKLIITLVILCLIGIFVYQNLAVLVKPETLTFNLYFVKPTRPVKVYLLVLVPLVVGFLLGLMIMMKFHFQTRRKLKRERMEKQQVQAALTQKLVNSAPVNATVPPPPEAPTGKEG